MKIVLNPLYNPQGGSGQELHPAQREIFEATERFKVVCCGRGFGKTALALAEIAKESMIPNSVIWYVGKTLALGMEQMWDRIISMYPKDMIAGANKTEKCIALINGTKIYIKGGNNLFAAENLRGARINLVLFDEAAFMKEDVWCKIIQSAVRRVSGRAIFFSTPNGYNWFKTIFEIKHPDWKIFHFTSYDNPHYPKEEIDAQRDVNKTLDEDISFRQEVLAEFIEGVGMVYNLIMDKHIDRGRYSGGKWYIGIDTGVNNDYTAFVWSRWTGQKYIVEFEYKNNKNSLEKHIAILKDISERLGCYKNKSFVNCTIVIDQSTNKTEMTSGSCVFAEFRKNGVPVCPSDRDKQLSIETIKKLMEGEEPRLKIMPNCKSVIEAMKVWEYGKHEPDILAAMRYAIRFAERHELSISGIESFSIDNNRNDVILEKATTFFAKFAERNE